MVLVSELCAAESSSAPCFDQEPSMVAREGGKYNRSHSLGSYGTLQSPLPMVTTPPLSPEHLEAGEARRKAEFQRSNTWDRIAAAGVYAANLWKLSQEMLEEKAKSLTDMPIGKLKVH